MYAGHRVASIASWNSPFTGLGTGLNGGWGELRQKDGQIIKQ